MVAGNQRRAVEDVCATNKARVWVAEVDGTAVGFVAVEIYDPECSMGEISMLAVDPDHQGSGIGTALSKFALDRLRDAGMKVAMVEKEESQDTPRRGAYEREATSSFRSLDPSNICSRWSIFRSSECLWLASKG